jgi:hypothetical protein
LAVATAWVRACLMARCTKATLQERRSQSERSALKLTARLMHVRLWQSAICNRSSSARLDRVTRVRIEAGSANAVGIHLG